MPPQQTVRWRVVPFLTVLAAGCVHARAAGPRMTDGEPASAYADDDADRAPVAEAQGIEAESARPAALARGEGGGRTVAARLALQKAAPSAQQPSPQAADATQQLIVNGNVTLRTGDVAALVQAIRAHTAAVGGSVVSEEVRGDADEGHAHMRLRLPPDAAAPFVDWLATQATLVSRALEANDVSRAYFDQTLAIKNLQITMGRLQELAARPNAALNDVLQVERELTRVRGEIEQIEGEHRLLADQIARATLAVAILPRPDLHAPPDIHVEPELKFELVPHLNALHFLDQRQRAQTRGGGGVSLMFSRAFTLDFTALPRHDGDARSFLFSASMAGYSDFLGGGHRRYLNPYLGLCLGGGLVNDHGTFAFGGEVGVELLRTKLFLVDVTGRALGFIYGSGVSNDVVLEGVAAVGVPF